MALVKENECQAPLQPCVKLPKIGAIWVRNPKNRHLNFVLGEVIRHVGNCIAEVSDKGRSRRPHIHQMGRYVDPEHNSSINESENQS